MHLYASARARADHLGMTGVAALFAWVVLALLLLPQVPALVRRARAAPREAAALLALTLAALALRLSLPWGPLSFAEAERLDVLFAPDPSRCLTMCTVPVAVTLLRGLGAGVDAVLRITPAVVGALGVTAAYALARAAGMRAGAAAVAAGVVATWPAHLHYSTSLTFSVEGATLATFAFAAALAPTGTLRARPAVVALLAALVVLTRPELRLLLPALALATVGWSWRERGVGLAVLTPLLLPYLAFLRPDGAPTSNMGVIFARSLFRDHALCPWWWPYLAAAGLVAALLRRELRAAGASLALGFGLLAAVYLTHSTEANPHWGQWRYFVVLVPFVAAGVAALADSLARGDGPLRRAVVPALLVAAALTPAPNLRDLRRVEDHIAEFHYLRASAARVIRGPTDVLLLSNDSDPARRHVRVEVLPRMALSTRLGPLALPRGCAPGGRGPVRLRDLEFVARDCPETLAPDAVVYLGLSRTPERLAALEDRFILRPIEERTVPAVVSSWIINVQARRVAEPAPGSQQPFDPSIVAGARAVEVPVRLGWYRLTPRGPRRGEP
ncbi:MAG: hypothetical protein U0325_00185 [Polyangiales bacterium]